jgi:hypothetical protein
VAGTVAKLGDYYLRGRVPLAWPFADGVQPVRQVFELLADEAKALIESRSGGEDGGVELVIQVAGGNTQTVTHLYPTKLAQPPSGLPQYLGVEVADRRIWWDYNHLSRAYNIRRSGSPRLLNESGQPDVLGVLVNDVLYAKWSLKSSGDPWTAREVLEDVLGPLVQDGKYRIEVDRQIDVEGLEVDDPGSSALARVLGYLAGASVSVDEAGTVVVRDARDGQEELLVEAAKDHAYVGGGLPVFASHRLTRPREVRVFFTREMEIRFSFAEAEELDSSQHVTVSANRARLDLRSVENVAAVPDLRLNVPGAATPVFQGAWLPLQSCIAAWQADQQAGQAFDITADNLRTWYFNPGVFQALVQGGTEPSAVLQGRIMAAMASFRRQYRIPTVYLDRISDLRASRVSIRDFERGARAGSPVFQDWTVLYSIRGAVANPLGYRSADVFTGYAELLKDGRVSPFRVKILDHDQGVFEVEPAIDPRAGVAAIAPGRAVGPSATDGQIPMSDPREAREGGLGILANEIRLTTTSGSRGGISGFKMSTILTVIPAAPNLEARFHVETVKPQEAVAALNSAGVGGDIGPCDGPVLELRVNPSLLTAKFEWDDNKADEFDGALGVNPRASPELGQPANFDFVRRLAIAVAASAYAAHVDRYEGSITTALNPSFRPLGSASQVTHSLAPDGVARTSVLLPAEPQGVDVLALLPAGARRQLLGLVEIGRASR